MNGTKNIALVTGASSGIGLAMSTELARYGYPLLLVSNMDSELDKAARELEAKYRIKAIPLCMDLAQRDSAQKLFGYCESNHLTVDILINNAGIFFFKDVTDTSSQLMETEINLHILTPVMLSQFFAQQMIKENRKGYVLNMASVASRMMMPGIALYSSTKSFLRCFSRAMRNEIYDRGINITTISPGAVATGLYNLSPHYMKLGIRLGVIIPPERLAKAALKKMFKRKAEYIPGGFINRLFILIIAAMPEALVRHIKRSITKLSGT